MEHLTPWINQTLGRVAPAFECPAWDGSDACCNPEQGGKGDDVQYLKSVVEAITAKYNVDTSRIYLMGEACQQFLYITSTSRRWRKRPRAIRTQNNDSSTGARSDVVDPWRWLV